MCTLPIFQSVTFWILEYTPMWVCSMKWNLARQWWERRKTVSSTLFSVPLTSHYPVQATDRYWVTAKAALSVQKFFAVAKIRLQNLSCFAFQIRGTTLCPSTETKENFSFSNGNSFVLGKHEWLHLKPGVFKYTVSKNSMCELAVRQIINHEIEVSSSSGKERHTYCLCYKATWSRPESGNIV